MREYLIKGIEKIGVDISKESIEKLLKYFQILKEYNSHTNLTAIRDDKGIIEKHFLDSLLVQKNILKYIKGNEKAIDIGTGAGFPGMVLAIVNTNIQFTLLDSVGKKTKFLEITKKELSLENVEIINDRAENYINGNREKYDFGFCRGVSKLNVILEYEIPFLKVNGRFFPQKLEYEEELKEAENALKVLNSEYIEVYNEKLPYSNDKRVILNILKKSKNDEKYPRKNGRPLKKPL
ncbi:16S rRNA m(7)G-527 methyltransferase [Hypnocyclicus thermotrophus]|uniref:Ribosomal RNA small subunit methyltransferase G n=1 Tax=Hypnocyclicus thermotrophus TaxID=1627895 RepID=A0AA46DZZ2_9FUSO|nr:16S rRNA (guanine(527)-N(7))-methyltransferase RsmG [Hypnocyclicus thermotrophus]TDT71791.1 16S rRNA m(7)G-527 methyltransferase [Hypnocyclicus thermotrophus]